MIASGSHAMRSVCGNRACRCVVPMPDPAPNSTIGPAEVLTASATAGSMWAMSRCQAAPMNTSWYSATPTNQVSSMAVILGVHAPPYEALGAYASFEPAAMSGLTSEVIVTGAPFSIVRETVQ